MATTHTIERNSYGNYVVYRITGTKRLAIATRGTRRLAEHALNCDKTAKRGLFWFWR
jgi:hypothetical protein